MDTYTFPAAFERQVIWHLTLTAAFGKYLQYLEDVFWSNEVTKRIGRILLAYGKASEGQVPGSFEVLFLRFEREVAEGRIDVETADALEAWVTINLLMVDAPPPDPAPIERELADLVRSRRQNTILDKAIKVAGKRGNLKKYAEEILTAENLGQAEGSAPTIVSGIGGMMKILEQDADLKRLSTGSYHIDAVIDGGLPVSTMGLILASTGTGKCHRAGQGILMASGDIRKVEDIRLGDLLAGPSGPRRVLSTHQGRGEMYEIRPVKGAPWQVNKEHILTLVHTTTGAVRDVAVAEWLTWNTHAKHVWKLFHVPFNFTPHPTPLTVDPYFLGVLLGDGHLDNAFSVTSSGAEVGDEVRAQAVKYGLRVREEARGRATQYHLVSPYAGGTREAREFKHGLKDELEAIGLYGSRAGTKFVPPQYKQGSSETRLALLAGLMDTDGHFSSGSYDYVSKSETLANDIVFMARSLGFYAKVAACQKFCQTGGGGTYYRVNISGEGIDRIPCRVPSRRATPRQQVKSATRTGFAVVATGEMADYFGFTLDGDARYLLDDFTVTHNSFLSVDIACAAIIQRVPTVLVVLEDTVREPITRAMAYLSGMPMEDVRRDKGKSAEKAIEARWGQQGLGVFDVIKMEATGSTSAAIVDLIRKREAQLNVKFGMVVIDYLDPIEGVFTVKASQSSYEKAKEVSRHLHDYVEKAGSRLWLPIQSKRLAKALKKELDQDLDINDGADSQHKVRIADIVIALNRMSGPKGTVVDGTFLPTSDQEVYVQAHCLKHRQGRSDKRTDTVKADLDRAVVFPDPRFCPPFYGDEVEPLYDA